MDETLMFRQALCRYINREKDMTVVGEAGDGERGPAAMATTELTLPPRTAWGWWTECKAEAP